MSSFFVLLISSNGEGCSKRILVADCTPCALQAVCAFAALEMLLQAQVGRTALRRLKILGSFGLRGLLPGLFFDNVHLDPFEGVPTVPGGISHFQHTAALCQRWEV